MKKLLMIFIVLVPLCVTVAQPKAATFAWTYPLKRIDGSTLPATEIDKANIKCGVTSGGPYPVIKSVPYPQTSMPDDFVTGDGYHFCIGTVTGKGSSLGEGPPKGELKYFTVAGVVIVNPTVPAALDGFNVAP